MNFPHAKNNMETLNEDDLDWLTRVENRLAQMRKREAAHGNWFLIMDGIGKAIGSVHSIRQSLQSRFGKERDKDL